VKRLILGAVASTAAVSAAVLVPQVAGATGSTGGNSVYIEQYADYNLSGTSLDLGLQVRCTGGEGSVSGSVSQSPPQTPYPVTFSTGVQAVVCDGKTHAVALTVDGFGYDAGQANATVTLTVPSTLKTTTAKKCITIVVH
jgi:opacity protein-like surface antigen